MPLTTALAQEQAESIPVAPPTTSSKSTNADLVLQCKTEYDHALRYRQLRETKWQQVNDMYFGKKRPSLVSRANVHIPKMQGTIETFLSKIDDMPFIRFSGSKESQRPSTMKLNSLLSRERSNNDWDLKDILGKKEAALFGRTVSKVFASSDPKYKSYNDVIDVLDFLIDPMAGGLDPFAKANYCGQDNIIKSKFDLKNSKVYIKEAVDRICTPLTGDLQADTRFASHTTQRASLGLTQAVLTSQDSVRLVEWYTTYNGTRYYVLFAPEYLEAVRVLPLKEMFDTDEFPFSSWAPFPRPFEFWTPGLGELILEPNIIQNVVVSQILDNGAFRNYGMKAYDKTKVQNPDDLTPRPMGKVPVDGDPNSIIKDITFPDITPSIQLYNLVDEIFDRETGITSEAKGVPHSKRMSATEFAGLIDQTNDRFFTSNKTYRSHLKRMSYLWLHGVKENLTKAERVRILGPRGYQWTDITPDDLKGEFDIEIQAGIEEENNQNLLRDRWNKFAEQNAGNANLNQQFIIEKQAQLLGLTDDEVQRLLSPNMEGDWEILANAEAENEVLLDKFVEPNKAATAGHIQKHLDFARRTAGLKPEQIARIQRHAQQEIDYAAVNEDQKAKEMINKARMASIQAIQPTPAQLPPIQNPLEAPPQAALPNPMAIPPRPMPEQVRIEAIQNAPPNVEPTQPA